LKKKLSVASVFTGAAACAAAFTPTAAAAATAPGTATRADTLTAAAADNPLPGNITEINCTAADAHWFHLYWPAYSDHGPTCLGYEGTKDVDHSYVEYCAGNNYGWLTYLSVNGAYYTSSFYPGQETHQINSSTFYVLSVHISGYTTSGSCPS
jgi:hypothetical protein